LIGVGEGTYKVGEVFPLNPPDGGGLIGEMAGVTPLAIIDGGTSVANLIEPTGTTGIGVGGLCLRPAAETFAIESRGWPLEVGSNIFEGPGKGIAVSSPAAMILSNVFKVGPAVVTSGAAKPMLDLTNGLGTVYPGNNQFDSITTKPIIDHQAATAITARGNNWPKPPPICGYIQVGKGGSVVVDDGETCVAP
jgi:hypothetical protein